ncbi:hypothetical protein MK974_10490 [Burkholderia ambifaria]|uniref:hypothetical protein n=1 Tax=Burkholderia ambifaria TaxID=152480 RepID=UPI0022A8FB5F|nr:hypothetical protein [Burkholderia ambifaria]WAS55792.1 hypothetical protein MK974_10490 [Burkholderia ambifaria]
MKQIFSIRRRERDRISGSGGRLPTAIFGSGLNGELHACTLKPHGRCRPNAIADHWPDGELRAIQRGPLESADKLSENPSPYHPKASRAIFEEI